MTPEICLALTIYFESRGQPIEGQWYVAQTVINRVHSPLYPDTVCGVMKQKNQFSFWNDKHSNTPRKDANWKLAKKIAHESLSTNRKIHNDCHYHADYVHPNWHLKVDRKVGNHIFYKGGCEGYFYAKRHKKRKDVQIANNSGPNYLGIGE